MKLVGERRAIAAIVFAFFFVLYLMNALMSIGAPLGRLMWGFTAVYGLALFALVAGYFWARWYAVGVGLFGVIIGAIGLWKQPDYDVMIIFGLHVTATLMLWGDAMSASYDGQTAWREKLHMDDNAVQRLGRSVIRAGVSLPIVLAYALAPKDPPAALLAAGLASVGLVALVRMRTWGVLAIAGAGAVMLTLGIEHLELTALAGGGLLVAAAAPFAAPMLRMIRA
jgi:hypothetical protein